MLLVEPDFYKRFHCTAEKCSHSCCIGWEIDIDGDSLAYYAGLEGGLAREIQKNIRLKPEPHFLLDERERCPFLQRDGLCRLICEIGEEALCDICREHPRFYHFFENRTERGLGLCCEEAARLLLEGEKPLGFIGFGEPDAPGPALLLRERVYAVLRDGSFPLFRRMRFAANLCGTDFKLPDMAVWAGFYMGLERLDGAWTECLGLLLKRGRELDLETALNKMRYERLAEYFVFRHFAAEDEGRCAAALCFCFLSVCFICALDVLEGERQEHVRLYSSEIEYSDENIGLILDEIDRRA